VVDPDERQEYRLEGRSLFQVRRVYTIGYDGVEPGKGLQARLYAAHYLYGSSEGAFEAVYRGGPYLVHGNAETYSHDNPPKMYGGAKRWRPRFV